MGSADPGDRVDRQTISRCNLDARSPTPGVSTAASMTSRRKRRPHGQLQSAGRTRSHQSAEVRAV
jgi:hypothetical protein